MTAYLKQDIPERLHYNNNRRITPIVGIAGTSHFRHENAPSHSLVELGWTILDKGATVIKGDHGYDPEVGNTVN